MDPALRERFLAEACGGDEELRREVEGLLAADSEAGSFLEEAVAGGSELLQKRGDPLAGRRILGKYEVLERIGEGGFGAVYKGLDTVLQRHVAIKVCTSRRGLLRERFLREAEIAAGLQHPNITTLHDLGFDGETPFLVQEFLTGEDLEAKIERREELSLARRVEILLEVARGLEYAHGQGVLHRDVKPGNVRILESGEAKLMDFGIARLLGQVSGLTQEGEALGTVGYLAPEQLRNEGLDERADLFAYGVLAYELLTYQKPFVGESFSQVSYQVLYEGPKPLSAHVPECPPQLEGIISRCLDKDRGRRYQTMTEVIADLADLDLGAGSRSPSGDFAPQPPKPRRRRDLLGAVGVVMVLAFLVWWGARSVLEPGEDVAEPPAELSAEASSRMLPDSRADAGEKPSNSPSLGNPNREAGSSSGTPSALLSEAAGLDPSPAKDEGTGVSAEKPSGRPAGDSSAGARNGGRSRRKEAADLESGSAGEPREPLAPDVFSESSPARALPPTAGGTASPARAGSEDESPAPPEGAAPAPRPAGAEDLGLETPALQRTGTQESAEPPGSEDAPAKGELYGAASDVTPPELLDRPAPVYPERARLRKREARVVVAVLVDASGKVEHALVKSSGGSGLGFDESALAAARQATFRPATRGGVAGKMWTELSFEFQLE